MSDIDSKNVGGIGLKPLIFSLMLACSLTTLVGGSYFSYSALKNTAEDESSKILKNENISDTDNVISWIESNSKLLEVVASSKEIKSMNVEDSKGAMKRVQNQTPWFYSYYLINDMGMQISRSNEGPLSNVFEREYFKQGMLGKTTFQMSISKASNKLALLVGTPVKSENGEVIGVLGGGANLDAISDKITGKSIGKTGYSYIINSSGTIMAHKTTGLIGKKVDIVKQETENPISNNNVKEIARKIKGTDLLVVSQMDKAEYEEPLKAVENKFYFMVILSVLISGGLSFFLGGLISNRINRLVDISSKLSVAADAKEVSSLSNSIETNKGPKELRILGGAIKRLANSIKLALEALS